MRRTGGKYLSARSESTGNAAFSRLNLPPPTASSKSPRSSDAAVKGAARSTDSSAVTSPAMTSSISARMVRMASMNRSSSPLSSDSVGSTISVPGTGNASVGAWKPKSIRRLDTSSAVMPDFLARSRTSRMHSWATRPLSPT